MSGSTEQTSRLSRPLYNGSGEPARFGNRTPVQMWPRPWQGKVGPALRGKPKMGLLNGHQRRLRKGRLLEGADQVAPIGGRSRQSVIVRA